MGYFSQNLYLPAEETCATEVAQQQYLGIPQGS